MLELRNVLVSGQQASQESIRPGKANWLLQDNYASLDENSSHFFHDPGNVKMVDQGDAEDDIHRFTGQARSVSGTYLQPRFQVGVV